jgi:hypothetical protein
MSSATMPSSSSLASGDSCASAFWMVCASPEHHQPRAHSHGAKPPQPHPVGALPVSAQTCIHDASIEELDRIGERLLTAATLADALETP